MRHVSESSDSSQQVAFINYATQFSYLKLIVILHVCLFITLRSNKDNYPISRFLLLFILVELPDGPYHSISVLTWDWRECNICHDA